MPQQTTTTMVVPWRPMIDPMPQSAFVHWWAYLIPLSLLIAAVYKAIRMKDLKGYALSVVIMTIQIIAGMIGLTAASYLLVEVFVPFMRG